MFHADTLEWMKSSVGDIIMDANRWEYLLYVTAEGTKSEGWRGAILHGSGMVETQIAGVLTPMGPFRWSENPERFGWHGWFHEAWGPKSKAASGIPSAMEECPVGSGKYCPVASQCCHESIIGGPFHYTCCRFSDSYP